MARYAAIDIGTVTCRLLIVDVDEQGWHELYRNSKIVNLGEGVDATGMLAPAAIDRVCAVLAEYKEVLEQYSDEPITLRCMATSASRDASNAADFAARMSELGLDLNIIPGEAEAGLSFLGASADYTGERLLVSDIGGGSTELIAGVAGEGIVHAHSFNIGARRATERLLLSDPPTAEEQETLAAWVREEFMPFFEKLHELNFVPERYVAVAGTATSVVSVRDAMEPYDPERVHGATVSADELAAVTDRLAALPLEQRREVVGLLPKRAPIIVAGMRILQQVLALSGLPSYTASETDILEGIILDAASTAGDPPA